jgi:uncharacterized membrane protein
MIKGKSFWDSPQGQVVLGVVVVLGAALMIALAYAFFLILVFFLSQLGIDPGLE